MSKMKDMMIDITEVVMLDKYSYQEIADMFGIPVESVAAVAKFDFNEDELV